MTSRKTSFSSATLVLGLLAGAVVLSAAGCQTTSSSDLSDFAKTGVAIYAQKDPEAAAKYGRIVDGGTKVVGGVAGTVSPEAEAKIGEGVAINAFQAVGPRHGSQELQRYVNLVGRAVSRQSSRPDLLYSFAVVESPTPNAFAGPGGYIFVSTGALELMQNESELAGVLAHEIAHVTQRHMLKMYQQSQAISGAQEAAGAANAKAAEYAKAADFGSDVLFNRGLNPTMEYEADAVGIEYAALAGYDPRGLITFLESLSNATRTDGGWFQTHPATSSRLARLERKYQELGAPQGVVQAERFAAMKAKYLKKA